MSKSRVIFNTLAIPNIAANVSKKLADAQQLGEVEYLKMKYAIEVLLINISKVTIIYTLAVALGVWRQSLIVHVAYFILRMPSFGLHAKSSTVCTLVSSLFFIAIPMAARNLELSRGIILMIWIVIMLGLAKYAPAPTNKNRIGSDERKRMLKRKSLVHGGVLMAFVLVSEAFGFYIFNISTLLTIGGFLQLIMILPITYSMTGNTVVAK